MTAQEKADLELAKALVKQIENDPSTHGWLAPLARAFLRLLAKEAKDA